MSPREAAGARSSPGTAALRPRPAGAFGVKSRLEFLWLLLLASGFSWRFWNRVGKKHRGNGDAVLAWEASEQTEGQRQPESFPRELLLLCRRLSTRIMLTSTYVCVCVFVNIHIFGNMCMGADIYKNPRIRCISVGSVFARRCFSDVSFKFCWNWGSFHAVGGRVAARVNKEALLVRLLFWKLGKSLGES